MNKTVNQMLQVYVLTWINHFYEKANFAKSTYEFQMVHVCLSQNQYLSPKAGNDEYMASIDINISTGKKCSYNFDDRLTLFHIKK